MRVVLINPNSSAETTAELVAMASTLRPQWSVRGITAGTGPRTIVTPRHLRAAEADVAAASASLAFDEIDAIVLAAFGDPGIERLAAEAPVPVVGFGAAAVAEAAATGPFGIVTTTPALESALVELVRRGGAGELLRAVVFAEPGAEPAATARALADAVRASAVEAGTWLVGGGPLVPAARLLAGMIDDVVVDCLSAALRAVPEGTRT